MNPRRTTDTTTRSSLMVALVLHVIAFIIFFVWAAKTGRLDPILSALHVVPVAREKPKEPPKESKIDPPKPNLPNQAAPKLAAPVNPGVRAATAPPPAIAPAVAPPPSGAADFVFEDGAKTVLSSTNALMIAYKNLIEQTLRSHWTRPAGLADESFVVEEQIQLDPTGKIVAHERTKGSGHNQWDAAVDQAVALTKSISLPPPKGFPPKFIVRFDVTLENDALAPAQ